MLPLHSFLIEQVLGLYLIIMAIIMIARANYYRNLVKNLHDSRGIILVSAATTLIFGLIIAVMHNVWIFRFDLIVTIIAWLIVLKAILWLAFPECMISLGEKFYRDSLYYVMAVISGIIGIILLVHSYHVFGAYHMFASSHMFGS